MRMLKKLLAVALGAALTAGLALPAAAEGSGPAAAPIAAQAPQAVNVATWGTVAVTEDGRLHLVCPNENQTLSEVIMGITDKTLILDAVTLEAVPFEDIQDGDTVYAWVDPVMALSMPPQAGAQLILANIPADYAVPTYHQVVTAQMAGDGKSVTLLTDKNETFVVDENCALAPYLTRNVVTLESLSPGTMILLWQEDKAAEGEAPAFAPTRIVAFPYAYDGWLEVSDGGLSLSGEAVDLGGGTVTPVEGEYRAYHLAPLRPVCEQLGWQVSWDAQARAVTVTKGSAVIQFTLGVDMAVEDGDMATTLLAEPAIVGGQTVVAVGDLARLLGLYYPI